MSYHTPGISNARAGSTTARMPTAATVNSGNMSKDVPGKFSPLAPQDPKISMVELQQTTDLTTSQRGYLSTYLTNATPSAQIANYIETPRYTGRTEGFWNGIWKTPAGSSSSGASIRRNGQLLGNSPI